MIETNLPYYIGKISQITFKDSLFGLGVYIPRDQKYYGKYFAKTIDGGRTWDTTFSAPYDDNGININYIPPASKIDSGFWIGYSSDINNAKILITQVSHLIEYIDYVIILPFDNFQ